ncbi:hypothetical protein ACWOFR_09720 [Carnobacterium gallinarum]|uniref:hypothetical protein n=1 Tax=Carnobacterium gallinarum TaxID=2749 RepID=UPI00055170B7|nr:hypothetical protein [Carnobacterium gallinarum]
MEWKTITLNLKMIAKKWKIMLGIFILIIFLVNSCGNESKKYQGVWKSTDGDYTLKIGRNKLYLSGLVERESRYYYYERAIYEGKEYNIGNYKYLISYRIYENDKNKMSMSVNNTKGNIVFTRSKNISIVWLVISIVLFIYIYRRIKRK